MIAYEELVSALALWRERNGLPVGSADYLGTPPAPIPVSFADGDDGVDGVGIVEATDGEERELGADDHIHIDDGHDIAFGGGFGGEPLAADDAIIEETASAAGETPEHHGETADPYGGDQGYAEQAPGFDEQTAHAIEPAAEVSDQAPPDVPIEAAMPTGDETIDAAAQVIHEAVDGPGEVEIDAADDAIIGEEAAPATPPAAPGASAHDDITSPQDFDDPASLYPPTDDAEAGDAPDEAVAFISNAVPEVSEPSPDLSEYPPLDATAKGIAPAPPTGNESVDMPLESVAESPVAAADDEAYPPISEEDPTVEGFPTLGEDEGNDGSS